MMCRNSTLSDLRKFLLAGTLKKRFFTEIEVPFGATDFSCLFTFPPNILM